MDVHCSVNSRPLFMCSCDSEQTQTKLVKHLQDAVAEVGGRGGVERAEVGGRGGVERAEVGGRGRVERAMV